MSAWMEPIAMNSGPEWFCSLLFAATAKSAVVLAVAALANFALRRGRAAARHLVWTLGVAGSLCLPALSAVLPGWWVSLEASRPGPHVSSPLPYAARAKPALGRTDEIATIAQSTEWRPQGLDAGSLPGNPLGTTVRPVT